MSFTGLDGEVYFVWDGEAIKIGFSGSATHRLIALQSSHPRRLKILHKIPGTMADEKRLHQQFAHLNIHGEWFRPGPDLMAMIEGRDYALDQIIEVENVRIELSRWAADKSKKVREACRPIDFALEAVVTGKPFWNPTGQIEVWLTNLERELAAVKA